MMCRLPILRTLQYHKNFESKMFVFPLSFIVRYPVRDRIWKYLSSHAWSPLYMYVCMSVSVWTHTLRLIRTRKQLRKAVHAHMCTSVLLFNCLWICTFVHSLDMRSCDSVYVFQTGPLSLYAICFSSCILGITFSFISFMLLRTSVSYGSYVTLPCFDPNYLVCAYQRSFLSMLPLVCICRYTWMFQLYRLFFMCSL